ncbi:DUF4221 domain-containing protein [Belliella sp. R4-6]|uniref:DUF4221 domain-containing protein n=1 Tax=Belliella alkalica TaxID=1730871 RepID=A0ABS9VF01_9BACT|nr:DUF4221 domain-containing protein [Belliella alkalica]MCH7415024.1 DUF4221 domain-containing protein [Belliella alkalica]
MKIKLVNFVFSIVFLISCNQSKVEDEIVIYDGKVGEVILELDSLTPSYIHHFQIIDEEGRKLLYALSPIKNRFLVYDLNSGDFVKSFTYKSTEKQPVNIGKFENGFHYHSQDSIFIVSLFRQIFIGNENGDLHEIFNIPKKYENQPGVWPFAIPNSKPIFYNDSILSLGGVNEKGLGVYEEGLHTDFNLILRNDSNKKNSLSSYLDTKFPKGNYIVGNFYVPKRKQPSRFYSKPEKSIYYSFVHADSLYIKDISTGKLKPIFAKINHMESFMEIESVNEFQQVLSTPLLQREYNAKQGRYSTVAVNEEKNVIIRVAYLGIKDFNIDLHSEGHYKKLNYGITFIDRKEHRQLKTIYLQNIDDTSILFDEDYFYVFCFDSQKGEDKLILDKYAYPKFN